MHDGFFEMLWQIVEGGVSTPTRRSHQSWIAIVLLLLAVMAVLGIVVLWKHI